MDPIGRLHERISTDCEEAEAEITRLRAAITAFVEHHDDGQTGQPGYPRTYGELDVWQSEWDRRYAALKEALK
jgi:hypothetical protein